MTPYPPSPQEIENLKSQYFEVLKSVHTETSLTKRNTPITLVAVSKTQPFWKIKELYQLGHRDFGENYVQELLEKANEAKSSGLNEIRWHFIGHLQSNKVKKLLSINPIIHTVDSLSLAESISKHAKNLNLHINILLQINIDQEDSKSGFFPLKIIEEFNNFNKLSNLNYLGLMCIPNPDLRKTHAEQLDGFLQLLELAKKLKEHSMGHSMGMSHDYPAAIEAGAQFIRIGTAIFGERNVNKSI